MPVHLRITIAQVVFVLMRRRLMVRDCLVLVATFGHLLPLNLTMDRARLVQAVSPQLSFLLLRGPMLRPVSGPVKLAPGFGPGMRRRWWLPPRRGMPVAFVFVVPGPGVLPLMDLLLVQQVLPVLLRLGPSWGTGSVLWFLLPRPKSVLPVRGR